MVCRVSYSATNGFCTENGLAAAAQITFRRDDADGLAGESVCYMVHPQPAVCFGNFMHNNYAGVERS